MNLIDNFPYEVNPEYGTKVAYFSMEFAIDQTLKTYSGGLGFLAGSHMRSAYELKQNMVGIGILWKYGYYDQVRQENQSMGVLFQEKFYHFLEDTGIIIPVYINGHQIYVKPLYLRPEIFNTCPMFFLTTDIPENDYLAQTITHRLYDSEKSTRIAQFAVLGMGGAKTIEAIWGGADIYHMNEGHPLPLTFYLYNKYRKLSEVKKRVVFTTHTPEKAGNEVHDIHFLEGMGYFGFTPLKEIREITGMKPSNNEFSLTLSGLRLAKIANGVSELHGHVSREMWGDADNICPIIHITNAQNKTYWADKHLQTALTKKDADAYVTRKKILKSRLNTFIADQTGKVFDENVLTLVWARRFAEYKRADLLLRDLMRFKKLVNNTKYPIQIVWAGKPYPFDNQAISTFNHLVQTSKQFANVAVLTGYELALSGLMKKGCDVWLNTPRRPREASGTSGMTAAMNGALNFSISDGWMPEFEKDKENCFVIPICPEDLQYDQKDDEDYKNMMDILENDILPMYYEQPEKWQKMVWNSMTDVTPAFGSNRMADDYYKKMYDI